MVAEVKDPDRGEEIDLGEIQILGDGEVSAISAHTLAKDNAWEAGFQLAAAVYNGFLLGYSLFILNFLGWIMGTICLTIGGCLSYYSNVLLARLAVIDGVRYYRFRDITASVYGSFGWWITIVMQWQNMMASNVGLVILAGQGLRGLHRQYFPDGSLKLPEWIAVVGAWLCLQAMVVPDLHFLRQLSIVGVIFGVVLCAVVIGVSAHDGATAAAGTVTYVVGLGEDEPTKVLNFIGALATIAFAYSIVIIPEIQATLREPVVSNFVNKSLTINYGGGAPIFLIITYVGWWAYGNNVAPNLIENLSGPQWAISVAWVAVVVQSCISFQIYSAPIFETADTAFYNRGLSPWSVYNFMIRLCYRIPYVALTCIIAALLPFFGDFVVLTGALSVLPLNFVVTFLLTVQVNKGMFIGQKIFLYSLAFFFALLTIATTAAAVRYIVVDSINYSVFSNT